MLAVVYLIFNEGYGGRGELAAEALRLGRALAELMPDEPEVHGLLAMMLLHDARREARFRDGDLVLLADQDRSLWDTAQIADGRAVLDRALALHGRGPYVVQAAIASLHADEPRDWPQIAALYASSPRLPLPSSAKGSRSPRTLAARACVVVNGIMLIWCAVLISLSEHLRARPRFQKAVCPGGALVNPPCIRVWGGNGAFHVAGRAATCQNALGRAPQHQRLRSPPTKPTDGTFERGRMISPPVAHRGPLPAKPVPQATSKEHPDDRSALESSRLLTGHL